nr:hypothetical protein [Tanacetum cinerariifolium]
DTHVQGNSRVDEPWYYDDKSCMKLLKWEEERNDGRQRCAKATRRKRVEEQWKKDVALRKLERNRNTMDMRYPNMKMMTLMKDVWN